MQDSEEKQKPARDVREQPVPNPNGKQPATEVPPAGDHVPVKSPERGSKGAADRGAQ